LAEGQTYLYKGAMPPDYGQVRQRPVRAAIKNTFLEKATLCPKQKLRLPLQGV